MTDDRQDDDDALRAAFAALRGADTERAPSFAALLAGDRVAGRRSLAPLLGGALAAAALLASVALGVFAGRPPTAVPAGDIGGWTAPTDFLLRTPGSEVLDTVPRIGATRDVPTLGGATAGLESERRSTSP